MATLEQQPLFNPAELEEAKQDAGAFRPIHYLGSKLRLVEPLTKLIHEAGPRNSVVCDLFAGSGTVSAALSRKHSVVAVDIQEYSRVICSALLTSEAPSARVSADIRTRALDDGNMKTLTWALAPLLELEDRALRAAAEGRPDALYDIIEHGSLIGEQLGQSLAERPDLQKALRLSSARLRKRGLQAHADSTVTRYFGGVYYSYRQALALDCIFAAVHSHKGKSRDRLLAAALGAASDTVNTVGRQFAQPIRPRSSSGVPKLHLVQKALKDRGMDVMAVYGSWVNRYRALPVPNVACHVRRMDYREALEDPRMRCDVIYADPPYTRDHYSRYYHALETMCLRDNPEISTATIHGKTLLSRGLYRLARHQSPFCIKTQAAAAFDTLCRGARLKGATLVISYSPFDKESSERPRVTSVDAIRALAKRYFSRVDIVSPGKVLHSKLTSVDMTVDTNSEAEQVLICQL